MKKLTRAQTAKRTLEINRETIVELKSEALRIAAGQTTITTLSQLVACLKPTLPPA